MATLRQDLGPVTAYAFAVEKGYTGTEEEFAELMASYATVAEAAAGSASDAADSASDAEAYGAGTRGGSAVESGDEAYHNNAKYYAESAADDASTVASAVNSFVNITVPAAVQSVTDEGTTQIGLVQGEGTTQIGLVSGEGTAQVSAVEAKGAEVLESIPEDYTELSDDVTDLKSALDVDINMVTDFESELFDSSKTIDGYYPTTAGGNAGDLVPNADAGTSAWINVKMLNNFICIAQTGGAHNFVFYDKNKNFIYGLIQNLSENVPFKYVVPFDAYPNVYYMRAAFYLTEKATFSIMGYRNCYDVESFIKNIGTPDTTYDFSNGISGNENSVTNVGTFWMTANPEMVALRGQKLKSITLNINTDGTVLTVRGYDGEIPMDSTSTAAKAVAQEANVSGYDIFKIINATSGESTYLLDGSDSRVEIIDETLICPKTLGLFKTGDNAIFKYYNSTTGVSDLIYFAHQALTDGQMRASRLWVRVVASFDNVINIVLNRSNGNKEQIFITPNDLQKLINISALRFNGWKMNCLGDSITYGYIPDSGAQMSKPYPNIVKSILGLAECRNYGISGSTLAVNSGNYHPMCIRYANMDDDADIVLVFGGTNDYGRAVYTPTLGTITDTANTTVYGALNILCEGLITKYPKAFIFLCTPLKRADKTAANDGGYTLEDVANAIREVGNKYGIPVLDLNYKGGFYIGNATFRMQYGGNDKLHPNQAFDMEHLAPMIARFIDSNI